MFGNGVESNRIRDDYNQVIVDKGPKVSTTLDEPYAEEHKASGLIYSGIYNSASGVNDLNQFIQAEKITKDLNPSYGSIQKLFARNTNLVAFCEDKVFKILAHKDALYNADGNAQLLSTNNVLGQTIPFSGDFGISKNPESFASESYRAYFTDRARGSVLRLSQDGISTISSMGMTDWFSDNLNPSNRIIGNFDERKGEYNVNLNYVDFGTFPVGILGNGKGGTAPFTPTNILKAQYGTASKLSVGDVIAGYGIPIGATIVSKINEGGGEWTIKISQPPSAYDVAALGDPILFGPIAIPPATNPVTWSTGIYVLRDDAPEPVTLSFSEKNAGWVSFKSFHFEDGLSLNNDYFTFKKGQLFKHHSNPIHNTFYDIFTESSVDILINEMPGSVKSFQTLDYEGSQSKITADTSNSGEYWDNEDKLGWYVDHMHTDLQEAEPSEFKDKEGKWFSTIKGIATEWLDDGVAGNIDTSEFSYQGIDDNDGIVLVDGGYTSWECQQGIGLTTICTEVPGLNGTYATESDCMADTTTICGDVCIVPNLVTSQVTNATYSDPTALSCTDEGSAAVEVVMSGNATSWAVEYVDAVTNVVVYTDPTAYNYNGWSDPAPLFQGYYKAKVIDNMGCESEVPFNIECVFDCSFLSPPITSLTTNNATMPGGGQFTSCFNANGNAAVTVTSIGTGAANFTIEWFQVVNGISTSIYLDPTVHAVPVAAGIVGLMSGDYEYVISDNLGCTQSSSFAIGCEFTTAASFDCDGQGHCTDPGTGLGYYLNYGDCLSNCKINTYSYNCMGGNCVTVTGAGGQYSSFASCQALCG